jgi:hypothetical protein
LTVEKQMTPFKLAVPTNSEKRHHL